MKSKFEMNTDYQEKFEAYLSQHHITNHIQPTKFIKIMKGHLNIINFKEIDNEQFIDLKNPCIVVLGDSVSGGHFEIIDEKNMIIAQDIQDSYVEKFKYLLHQKFPLTVINIINSALAGDNIKGMYKRLTRDVIMHQPDLVIINATLNWSQNRGNTTQYQYYYEQVIQRIIRETPAEIILLTPNNAVISEEDYHLQDRVEVVRKMASKYQLPMVDIYKMWNEVVENKDLKFVLSNHENHPTPLGHTYMAQAIMQIFKEDL